MPSDILQGAHKPTVHLLADESLSQLWGTVILEAVGLIIGPWGKDCGNGA